MKDRLKQLLLFGGLYQIVSLLVIFNQTINNVFYLLFIIGAFVCLIKRRINCLLGFSQKHNTLSVFLYALGWLPYFKLPYIILLNIISYKTALAAAKGAEYIPANPKLLETYFTFHINVSLWGGLLAIVLAFLYIIKQHLAKAKTRRTQSTTSKSPPHT